MTNHTSSFEELLSAYRLARFETSTDGIEVREYTCSEAHMFWRNRWDICSKLSRTPYTYEGKPTLAEMNDAGRALDRLSD